MNVLTIVAGVFFVAHEATFLTLVLRRMTSVNAAAFAAQIVKLEKANNRTRAIKLCTAATTKSAVVRLTVFMLGLELPAMVHGEDLGDASLPEQPFDLVARELVEGQIYEDGRAVRRIAIPAIALGALAGALGLAAWLTAGSAETDASAGPWGLAGAVMAALASVGTVMSVATWLRLGRGLRTVAEAVLPVLAPVEQMSEDAKGAAVQARALFEAPPAGVARSRMLVVAGALGATAVAGMVAFLSTVEDEPVPVVATGQIVEAGGQSPVALGASCELRVREDSGGFNCRVQVSCGGVPLYGATSSTGYTDCEWSGGRAMSAHDPEWDDGDPAMRFDVREAVVTVRDESWNVTIALATQ